MPRHDYNDKQSVPVRIRLTIEKEEPRSKVKLRHLKPDGCEMKGWDLNHKKEAMK